MKKYSNCYIIFDTNAFECRHSGKELFLYEIRPNNLFYNVRDVVEQLEVLNCTQLCIPEIVMYEIKHHLIDHYKSAVTSFSSKVEDMKKTFGDLFDIDYEIHGIKNINDYIEYVDVIWDEFLCNEKNHVAVLALPKDEEAFNNLVHNAIKGYFPFVTAKANGKEYHDAGFKDAIIWETIKRLDGDSLILFITNDGDFANADDERIKRLNNISSIKSALLENLEIPQDILFKNLLLSNDTYLLQQLMNENGFENIKSVEVESISECKFEDDEKILYANCDIIVDGVKLLFKIKFDLYANEFVESSFDEYSE